MSPQPQPGDPDSLEIIELVMELESLQSGEPMDAEERRQRVHAIRARLANIDLSQFGELGAGLDREGGAEDDGMQGTPVRRKGPRPKGSDGASVRPGDLRT